MNNSELYSVSKLKRPKSIGMDYDKIKLDWDFMFNLAKLYKYHYGNLDIPKDFKTGNGYKYNEDGYPLGEWFAIEQEKFTNGVLWGSKLSKWQELTFGVNEFLGSFETMMNLASKYYTVYRHLDVPFDFKTNDGVYYDENGYLLGGWIRMQQILYNQDRLVGSRNYELEKHGMIFDNSLEHWNFMYDIAKKYYKEKGNLNISFNYITEDGYFLGAWLYHQKHLIGTGKLDGEKIKDLQDIGVTKGIRSGLSREDWNLMYELAINHYNKYGNMSSAFDDRFVTSDGINNDDEGFNLGVWLFSQKKLLEEGNLSQWKEEQLYKIGIIDKEKEKLMILRNLAKNEWNTMYLLANNYYKKYGNLNVPLDYKTYDGIENDIQGVPLGEWVSKQKSLFNQGQLSNRQVGQFVKLFVLSDLEKKQISLLKKNIELSEKDEWDLMYKMVKAYNDEYNDLHIPSYFLTMDGVNYSECGYPLGKWIDEQKNLYFEGKLSNEQVGKLYDLGSLFSFEDTTWYNDYMVARVYYEHHGNLNVFYDFVTNDGINVSKYGTNLYVWVKKQIDDLVKDRASSYKIEKLREIGISKEEIEKSCGFYFEKMYEEAKKIYDNYGCVDPRIIKSYGDDCYMSSVYDILWWWVLDWKKKYNKGLMDEDTYKKMDAIGIFMTGREAKWNSMFKLASKFYKNYGHLDVPFEFKTFDGIKHEENGLELGKWIRNQQINLKNDDKINKLNTIGMIWIVRSATEEIEDICLIHGIDFKEHKDLIKRISIIEFISKSNYLISNGYSLMVDGKLHEIFSMSSVDIKQKYGLSLEEIINNYYNIKSKNRGL